MNFDIRSMKQRARELMKSTTPKSWILGIAFAAMFLIYGVVLYCIFSYKTTSTNQMLFWLLLDIVYMIFRNSCKLYGLKVTRDEQTSLGDAIAVLHEKPVQSLCVGIIKEICLVIGLMLCVLAFFLPFYLFRMSEYIIKDEEVNPLQALGRSVKLLRGHYVELMKLDISFLGWNVLTFCTLGIAGIFVKPYKGIVYAEFYDYLKAQKTMFS